MLSGHPDNVIKQNKLQIYCHHFVDYNGKCIYSGQLHVDSINILQKCPTPPLSLVVQLHLSLSYLYGPRHLVIILRDADSTCHAGPSFFILVQ